MAWSCNPISSFMSASKQFEPSPGTNNQKQNYMFVLVLTVPSEQPNSVASAMNQHKHMGWVPEKLNQLRILNTKPIIQYVFRGRLIVVLLRGLHFVFLHNVVYNYKKYTGQKLLCCGTWIMFLRFDTVTVLLYKGLHIKRAHFHLCIIRSVAILSSRKK